MRKGHGIFFGMDMVFFVYIHPKIAYFWSEKVFFGTKRNVNAFDSLINLFFIFFIISALF